MTANFAINLNKAHWRSEGDGRGGPPSGPGRQSGGVAKIGLMRGIRHITTFGGGKIAVSPGRR